MIDNESGVMYRDVILTWRGLGQDRLSGKVIVQSDRPMTT